MIPYAKDPALTEYYHAAAAAEALGLQLTALTMIQERWSQKTFGADNVRGPEAAINHLRREVEELAAAPHDRMEYADCLLLIIDAARRAGFPIAALLDAATEKQQICLRRKWGPPDTEGVCSHVA